MPAFEQSRCGLPSSPLPTTHYSRTCARKISLLQTVQPGPDLRGGRSPYPYPWGSPWGSRPTRTGDQLARSIDSHPARHSPSSGIYATNRPSGHQRRVRNVSDELIQACLLLARSLTRRRLFITITTNRTTGRQVC